MLTMTTTTTTLADILSALESRGLKVKMGGNGYMCQCPAHDDKNPSLSVWEDEDGKPAVNCFAGCSTNDIWAALGIGAYRNGTAVPKTKIITPPKPAKRTVAHLSTDTYTYTDAKGKPAYTKTVKRYTDGTKQAFFRGTNGESKRPGGALLYQLHRLFAADKAEPVYIVEGEKDADTLRSVGLLATTADAGANSKFLPSYADVLAGRHIVILPDNDNAGETYGQTFANGLLGVAASVKLVNLPVSLKGDVSDYLAAYSVEDLQAIVNSTRPWKPQLEAEKPKPEAPNMGWQLRTLADAYQPRPPLRYIVEDVLPEGSLSLWFGLPGSMKSMVLADLAVCVAAGERWLPLQDTPTSGYAVEQGAVLWIDCDNGTRRTDARFEALARARNAAPETPLYYVSMPTPALDLSKQDSVATLAGHVRAIGARLVILDNLGLITGDTEENSAGMASVMNGLRQIAETGAAVAVIHHQRKTRDDSAAMNVIRGHSSIVASLDLAVNVERDGETPGSLQIVAAKLRDADFPFLGAEFSYQHKDGTNELQTARFWGRQSVDTKSPQAIERAIFDCLSQGGLNQSQILEAVKNGGIEAGQNSIRQRLDGLVSAQKLVQERGENNAKIYKIAY